MKAVRPLISIIIPTWNGKHLLAECLPSVLTQTEKDFEIIIVDNGSIDGTQDFIKKKYPEVVLIDLNEKSGFAKPVNTGIKFARGNYVALINNDVILDKNWLKTLVSSLSRNRKIGFCACLMLDPEGKRVDSAGDGFSWWGRAYPIGRGKSPQNYQEKKYVFGASGGASIFKKEVLDKVGLLDEDFYAYFEDVDLSFRAQLAGYKCLYVADAVCFHRGSASFKRDSFEMRAIGDRNKDWVIIKNVPLRFLITKSPKMIIAKIKSLYVDFWQGLFFAGLKALVLEIMYLPKMIKKRQAVQRMRRVSDKYLDSIINNSHPKIEAK